MSITHNIFSIEQKNYIINQFPNEIQNLLRNVNNPLDEREILNGIFEDKNVRMVMKYEKNKYNVLKWVIYYNVNDIADVINYSNNTHNWKNQWKIEYISYNDLINNKKNLPLENQGANKIDENVRIINPLNKRTDHNANYIHQKYLSTVLINTTKQESEIYKYWILEMPEIIDCALRILNEIKKDWEIKQIKEQKDEEIKLLVKYQLNHDEKIKEHDKIVNENKKLKEQVKNLNAHIPKKKVPIMDYIYIWGISIDDGKFKMGFTKKANDRISELSRGNVDGKFLHLSPCFECDKYEKIIHSIFSKYRIRDTEYFEISFDICKNAIDSISMISNAVYENMEHVALFNLSSKIEKLVDEFKKNIKKNNSNKKYDKCGDDVNNYIENDDVNKSVIDNNNDDINGDSNSDNSDNIDNSDNDSSVNNNSENDNKIKLDFECNMERHNILTESKNFLLFPRDKYEDPNNFEKFIKERCVINNPDYCTEKQTLKHAYMCWVAFAIDRETLKKFDKYMDKNFNVKSIFNENFGSNMLSYSGIQLKDIELLIPKTSNDYYLFLQEKCHLGPNYSITTKELHEEYNKWAKTKNGKQLALSKDKTKINKFMENIFYRSQGVGDKNSRGERGFRGFCVEINEHHNMNTTGKQNKIILKIDAKTNEIIQSWTSLTIAAKELNIGTSSLSQDAIYNSTNDSKRARGEFYYMYENYIETKRKPPTKK